MANPIEFVNTDPATTLVDGASRYRSSTVIRYSELKKLTYTTYKRKPYVPKDTDRFATITKGFEYRPDLLSNKMYGDPSFWWRIMEVNGLKDIYEFKTGLNVIIPDDILA